MFSLSRIRKQVLYGMVLSGLTATTVHMLSWRTTTN
jgi:hypothetical protein